VVDVDRKLGDVGKLVDLGLTPGHDGVELLGGLRRKDRGGQSWRSKASTRKEGDRTGVPFSMSLCW
jgi:hypothetical protein